MEGNHKKKDISSIIGFIISISLAIIIVLIYKFIIVKEVEKNNLPNQVEESYTLKVYQNNQGKYCKEKNDYCNKLSFIINTKDKEARILAFDDNQDSYMLYKDSTLKIYDILSQKIQTITLEDKYKNYQLNVVEKQLVGIIYQDNNYDSYYNLENNSIMYKDKYNLTTSGVKEYLNAKNIEDNKNYLLKTDEEKIEIESLVTDNCSTYFLVNKVNNKFFYFENMECDNTITKKIYSNNKEILGENLNKNNLSIYKDYLYILDNKVIKKYDVDGNLINSSKEFKNVKQLINDYVIYLDNDYLKIYNLNTKEEKEIVKWDNSYTYDELESKYYDNEGIYIVIYYPEQDSNGNYGMKYIISNDLIKEVAIKNN